MRAADADPEGMRDSEKGLEAADPFGLAAPAPVPPPATTFDERRRLLVAELRALIEHGEYDVPSEDVAQAMIDHANPIIEWLD